MAVLTMAFTSCMTPHYGYGNTQMGSVVGGVLGAAAGAAIGENRGRELEGAAIGGAIGAIAGATAGSAQDSAIYGSQLPPVRQTVTYPSYYRSTPTVRYASPYYNGRSYGYPRYAPVSLGLGLGYSSFGHSRYCAPSYSYRRPSISRHHSHVRRSSYCD